MKTPKCMTRKICIILISFTICVIVVGRCSALFEKTEKTSYYKVIFSIIGGIATYLSFTKIALFNDTTKSAINCKDREVVLPTEVVLSTVRPYFDILIMAVIFAITGNKPVLLIHLLFLPTDFFGLCFGLCFEKVKAIISKKFSNKKLIKVLSLACFCVIFCYGALYSAALFSSVNCISDHINIFEKIKELAERMKIMQDNMEVVFIVLPLYFSVLFYSKRNESYWNGKTCCALLLIFLSTMLTWFAIHQIIGSYKLPANQELFLSDIEGVVVMLAGIVSFMWIEFLSANNHKNQSQSETVHTLQYRVIRINVVKLLTLLLFLLVFFFFVQNIRIINILKCLAKFLLFIIILAIAIFIYKRRAFLLVQMDENIDYNSIPLLILGGLLMMCIANKQLAIDPLSLLYLQRNELGDTGHTGALSFFRAIAFTTIIIRSTIRSGILPMAGLTTVFYIGHFASFFMFSDSMFLDLVLFTIGFIVMAFDIVFIKYIQKKWRVFRGKYPLISDEYMFCEEKIRQFTADLISAADMSRKVILQFIADLILVGDEFCNGIVEFIADALLASGIFTAGKIYPIIGPFIVVSIWTLSENFYVKTKYNSQGKKRLLHPIAVGPLGVVIVQLLEWLSK